VIVLMLRLGLRATEVATLRLEDLDWRAGQLTVHGKGGRVDQLPLPVDVGEAIAAYLRRGRPRDATVREVFLRVAPPQVGWAWAGAPAAPHRGQRLLRAGAPLAEIGQVLRHRRAGRKPRSCHQGPVSPARGSPRRRANDRARGRESTARGRPTARTSADAGCSCPVTYERPRTSRRSSCEARGK